MDNDLLIYHISGETPLNNIILYLFDETMLKMSSTWSQGNNVEQKEKLEEFMKLGGFCSSHE